MKFPTTTYSDILAAIENSNIGGHTIALHSSLKSFGYLDGGAQTLIDVFLDSGCTLLVPTFTYMCAVESQRKIVQNADKSNRKLVKKAVNFTLNGSLISSEMGSIPSMILKTEGRIRGRHPLNSLTALGTYSKILIESQGPLNVYGPYKKMYEMNEGFIVLAGVDLTKATSVHFAEEKAGRHLFRRWGLMEGQKIETEVGSCSDGFENLRPFIKDIENIVYVGSSVWRVYLLREFIDRVVL